MNWKYILLIILVSFIVGFLAWYYSFNKKETIILDGEEYISEQYGFSLSLPKDWKIMDEERRSNNINDYNPDYAIWLESPDLDYDGARQSIWVYIMEMQDYEEISEEAFRKYINMSSDLYKEIVSEDILKISGISGTRAVRDFGILGEREDICLVDEDIIYVFHNGYPLEGQDHSVEASDIFYQVVSSFKTVNKRKDHQKVEEYQNEVQLVTNDDDSIQEATSFDDCIVKGNPILDFPLGYRSVPRQCESFGGKFFMEELKWDTDSSEADWQTCEIPSNITKKIDSFDCPVWMDDITWDESYQDDFTVKFKFYNSIDKENQRGYLSTNIGDVVFVIDDLIEDPKHSYSGSSIIKSIYSDHTIAIIYENLIENYWEELGELKFSPDGQYISFILNLYESHRVSTININTGEEMILPTYEVKSAYLDQIVWSLDGKYVAIDNDLSGFSGMGAESILLGRPSGNFKLEEIFIADNGFKGITDELEFNKQGDALYFVSGRTHYKYDLDKGELIVE